MEEQRPRVSRSRWFLAVLTCLLVVLVPLAVLERIGEDPPELRIVESVESDGRFSALLVTDRSRLLLLNTTSRTEARALFGRLARPWEPAPTSILVPADDQSAAATWEALQRAKPDQLLVAGVPGADPTWHLIERHCREHDIRISYLTSNASLNGSGVNMMLRAERGDGNQRIRALTVGRSGVSVALPIGDTAALPDSHVAVGNGLATGSNVQRVLISGSAPKDTGTNRVVTVDDRELIRIVLEESRLRVRGGTLIEQPDQSSD